MYIIIYWYHEKLDYSIKDNSYLQLPTSQIFLIHSNIKYLTLPYTNYT